MSIHAETQVCDSSTVRYAARRAALIHLIVEHCGGSQAGLARKTGLSESYISRMVSAPESPHHKRMGEDVADRIAEAFGLNSLTTEQHSTTGGRPKTGITVASITAVQRDLARHAAAGNVDVATTCVQAQAVIEGLLSGLDAGQLA